MTGLVFAEELRNKSPPVSLRVRGEPHGDAEVIGLVTEGFRLRCADERDGFALVHAVLEARDAAELPGVTSMVGWMRLEQDGVLLLAPAGAPPAPADPGAAALAAAKAEGEELRRQRDGLAADNATLREALRARDAERAAAPPPAPAPADPAEDDRVDELMRILEESRQDGRKLKARIFELEDSLDRGAAAAPPASDASAARVAELERALEAARAAAASARRDLLGAQAELGELREASAALAGAEGAEGGAGGDQDADEGAAEHRRQLEELLLAREDALRELSDARRELSDARRELDALRDARTTSERRARGLEERSAAAEAEKDSLSETLRRARAEIERLRADSAALVAPQRCASPPPRRPGGKTASGGEERPPPGDGAATPVATPASASTPALSTPRTGGSASSLALSSPDGLLLRSELSRDGVGEGDLLYSPLKERR